MNTIKNILAARRAELHLTLDDVAKAVGVSKTTISRWESGKIGNMRRDRIAKLAKVLHISPIDIIGMDKSSDVIFLRPGEFKPDTAPTSLDKLIDELFADNPKVLAIFKGPDVASVQAFPELASTNIDNLTAAQKSKIKAALLLGLQAGGFTV